MTEQILPYFGGAKGEACRIASVAFVTTIPEFTL